MPFMDWLSALHELGILFAGKGKVSFTDEGNQTLKTSNCQNDYQQSPMMNSDVTK